MQFKIEDGIEIPNTERGSASRYPFKEMRPGQSFFVPAEDRGVPKTQARCTGAIAYYRRKNSGFRFITRRVVENGAKGVRIWCIEHPDYPHENVSPIRATA